MKKENGKVFSAEISDLLHASLQKEAFHANTSVDAVISKIIELHIRQAPRGAFLKARGAGTYAGGQAVLEKKRRHSRKVGK